MDATADDWLFDSGDGGEEESPSSFSRIHDKVSSWGNMMQERAMNNGAKGVGRFAESNATKLGNNGDEGGSAIGKAQGAEKFINNVAGKTLDEAAAKAVPGGKAIMQQARKLGPAGTILGIFVIFGFILSGVGAVAPFGFVANLMDHYNMNRTSMNRREKVVQRIRLRNSRKSPAAKKASFLDADHLEVSDSMKKSLKKQNIFYFGEADKYSTRFLVYQDEKTGTRYAVTADGGGEIPDKVKVPIDGDEIEVDIHKTVSIDDAYGGIRSFKRNLDVGTRTLRGHVAGWFDELSDLLHMRIGSNRNKYKDTSKTASEDEIRETSRTANKGMNEDIKGDTSDAQEDRAGFDEDPDPGKVKEDMGVDKESTRGKKAVDVEADIDNSFRLKARNIIASIGDIEQFHCAVLRVYAAFNTIVAAMTAANVINFTTAYLESVQKTQIGDGGELEMSVQETDLSRVGVTYGSTSGLDTHSDYENVVYEGKSGKETPAYNEQFSSGAVRVSKDDPVAMKLNSEYVTQQTLNHVLEISAEDGAGNSWVSKITSGILGYLGNRTANEAYKECLYADIASETAEATFDVVLAFFTGGAGNIIKSLLEMIGKALFKAVALGVVVGVIASIFSAMMPQVAQMMVMSYTSRDTSSVNKAFALAKGSPKYMGEQIQSSSGLPATEETMYAFWREQQDVIAEEGELERSMRSPFDPTSKYTFIGSIVNSLIPVANTISSPVTSISAIAGTIGSALMGLRPTANAEGEAEFETSINRDCPNLSNIGVIANAFCDPYFVSDMSTINEDPADVFDAVALPQEKTDDPIDGNFIWDAEAMAKAEEEGVGYNPPINPKGDLAKWVVSCAARDSGFGIVDSNVMNSVAQLDITGNGTLDTAIQTGVSAIPIVGSVVDIKNSFKELKEYDWATGKNCVSEDYKYYSRYSEDQRLLESSGLIEESAVASFLKEYYKENPIDTSYEGVVARRAGMTKDEYEDTLATVQAIVWIAEYNPEGAGPMEPLPEKKNYQYESNDIVAAEFTPVLVYKSIYDDLRTKVKVA